MKNYYAGIGSRETPEHILTIMHHLGAYMADQGWTLRSGAAQGADYSFEEGAVHQGGETEIYLPWKGFNFSKSELHPGNYPFSDEERAYAAQMHPAWNKCSPSARLLHQRNTRQLIGIEQLHGENVVVSKMLICWTEGGLLKGGTAQALRIATSLNIPIINLGRAQNADELEAMVLAVDEVQGKLKNQQVLG